MSTLNIGFYEEKNFSFYEEKTFMKKKPMLWVLI